MKGMFKRALAGVAATALAVTGLALGAGAANAASITVNNAQDGHTYTAYKIASYEKARLNDAGSAVEYVDVVTNPSNAGSVSAAIANAGFAVSKPYVDNPAAWLASQRDNSTLRQFAEAFAKLSPAPVSAGSNADGNFSSLEEGWYVITDTYTDDGAKAGTPMVVSTKITVNGALYDFEGMTLGEVVSKHDTTTRPGKTAEEKDEALGVGEYVNYTVTTEVPNLTGINTQSFKHVVKDTPSRGLNVSKNDVKVYVADKNGEKEITVEDKPVKVTDITSKLVDKIQNFEKDGSFTGNNSDYFSVDLSEWMKQDGQSYKGAKVYIQYKAQINIDVQENSEVSNTPAIDNGSETDIQGDEVEVKVGGFKFHKYGVGGDVSGLAGAKFKVFEGANVDVDTATPLKFSKTDNGNGYVRDVNGQVIELESTTSTVLVNGLKADTYTVYESTVPTGGYSDNFHAKFTVTVKDDGTWELGSVNDHSLATQVNPGEVIDVLNVKSFTELPTTGAAGTALFTVLGVLIAGAGALVYMKSRNVKHALRG